MNIGFDLDKIFINYPPLIPDRFIDYLYKQKVTKYELLYRIPSRPEQYIRILSHYPIFRPAISKNVSVVKNETLKKNHTYLLISSRFSFLEKRTAAILRKYGLDQVFEGMYFNTNNQQPHMFKNELMQKLHIDRYVDDDLPLLTYLARLNKKTRFYWLNKNEERKLQPNLYAIKKLAQIFS